MIWTIQPVHGHSFQSLLQVHVHNATQGTSIPQHSKMLILCFSYARHQYVVSALRYAQPPAARIESDTRLAAGITDEQNAAILFTEARDTLVIICSTVYQPRDKMFWMLRVKRAPVQLIER